MAKIYLDVENKLDKNDFIVSKTDHRGNIIYCNRSFIELSKFTEEELLSKPHNLIRHRDMPKAVFKLLWKEINQKNEVFAYVKNRSKDGSFYWVYANVTASSDSKGKIIGYYSVRRKANQKALDVIKPIYKKMSEIESRGSVDDSLSHLMSIVDGHHMGYNELMIHLQNNL